VLYNVLTASAGILSEHIDIHELTDLIIAMFASVKKEGQEIGETKLPNGHAIFAL
jgi:hypothetical protein